MLTMVTVPIPAIITGLVPADMDLFPVLTVRVLTVMDRFPALMVRFPALTVQALVDTVLQVTNRTISAAWMD